MKHGFIYAAVLLSALCVYGHPGDGLSMVPSPAKPVRLPFPETPKDLEKFLESFQPSSPRSAPFQMPEPKNWAAAPKEKTKVEPETSIDKNNEGDTPDDVLGAWVADMDI